MNRYIVLRDNHGSTFAGETWAAAIEAAQPDEGTDFVDAAWVDAVDAGAARLLLGNAGARAFILSPPRRYTVQKYDANGDWLEGWDVVGARTVGVAWLSMDMALSDIQEALRPFWDDATADYDVGIDESVDVYREHDRKPLGNASV